MLNSKSIGNKIASERKKLNLSQADLAQKVAISPQAVGKWERGESQPDVSTLNRLAEIFGVDLNFFSDSFRQTAFTGSFLQEQTAEIQATVSEKKPELNWDMSQGNWADADFSGLNNLKEKFSSSNMKNCKFTKSELSGLLLAKNNIEKCDFSGSDIRDSKFQSSNLSNNLFNNCSLIDAEFLKCNIQKCDFSAADFSGAELLESNLESCVVNDVTWKLTKFKKSNISKLVFSGLLEDCHFEHCGFYNVRFENATLVNTFFKYNDRFKKVEFVNCKADSLTMAFLKNNQTNLAGVSLLT